MASFNQYNINDFNAAIRRATRQLEATATMTGRNYNSIAVTALDYATGKALHTFPCVSTAFVKLKIYDYDGTKDHEAAFRVMMANSKLIEGIEPLIRFEDYILLFTGDYLIYDDYVSRCENARDIQRHLNPAKG